MTSRRVQRRRRARLWQAAPGRLKTTQLTGTTFSWSGRNSTMKASKWRDVLWIWDWCGEDSVVLAVRSLSTGTFQITLMFTFLSPPRFFSSQGDEPLLLDKSSFPSLQTDGATELNDECCKLKDVVDKMVISHWLRKFTVEHCYDIKCNKTIIYVAMRFSPALVLLDIVIKHERKKDMWAVSFHLPSEFLNNGPLWREASAPSCTCIST